MEKLSENVNSSRDGRNKRDSTVETRVIRTFRPTENKVYFLGNFSTIVTFANVEGVPWRTGGDDGILKNR